MTQTWPALSAGVRETFVRHGGGVQRQSLDDVAKQRVIQAFIANPHFRNMPVEVIEWFANTGYEKTWLHGELLIAYGEACKEILVVITGVLGGSWLSPEGARVTAEYIQPNEVINIIPAFDGKGSMMDIRAHGTATVFHIPREAMLELFERVPEIMRGFLSLICSRSREQHRRVRMSRLSDFRTRIADRLLDLANRYGRDVEDGVEIALKISQDDLASLLGVSRQSINRELRQFSDQGWIGIRYGKLTIYDRESLRRLNET